MGLKEHYCEMFELSFRLAGEDIDEPKLLEAMGLENKEAAIDEDGDVVLATTFGPAEKTTDYHGHVRIVLFKDGKSRVDLRYHANAIDSQGEEEPPPHAEDCAPWLAQFFKKEELNARMNVAYVFDGSFAPTIALPFPLATSEKALTGGSVTGVSIQFPESERLAIIQRAPDETYATVFYQASVSLATFDISNMLEQLDELIGSLVRKQESPSNEIGSTKKE